MLFSQDEIIETIDMVSVHGLDVRAVTLGVNLLDCADSSARKMNSKTRRKLVRVASRLVSEAEKLEAKYGVPIVNKRLAVTPASLVIAPAVAQAKSAKAKEAAAVGFAHALDDAAAEIGIDLVGGFSATAHSGITAADAAVIGAIPDALSGTKRVCSSIIAASTQKGINTDAVLRVAAQIKEVARRTPKGFGAAKIVVLANAPENIPFMAGAFHAIGCGESCLNVGISGPGVVRNAVAHLGKNATLPEIAEEIKKTSFKITRAGELVGTELAQNLGVEFGAVDLSLAPTTREGDSVAEIFEAMGIESAGAPGTTAALFLLNNAVKKGGSMATSRVGGYSGAFIPVSEDSGMIRAVQKGSMTLEKLEAMTSVCSVGIDMVAIPGSTSVETIAGIIADGLAIGCANNKSTGVRIIPIPGAKPGDKVEWGGLFGTAIVMPASKFSSAGFVRRGGQIPAPITSARN